MFDRLFSVSYWVFLSLFAGLLLQFRKSPARCQQPAAGGLSQEPGNGNQGFMVSGFVIP